MFTGLVQQVGTLRSMARSGGGARIAIDSDPWPDPLVMGESVAVQGICLTVAGIEVHTFFADVLDETLDCTALGDLKQGARLNLERALRYSDRLGGHLVNGHIDTVSILTALRPRGRDRILTLRCEPAAHRYLVPKGSVALDGVSLTLSALLHDEHAFEVNLIPTTWMETSLSDRRVGDRINLETDVLGKYVERLMRSKSECSGVTLDSLVSAGFPV